MDGRWIVWPDRRFVSAAELISWASDDVGDGLVKGPKPKTLEEAVEILKITGSVTLARENYDGP